LPDETTQDISKVLLLRIIAVAVEKRQTGCGIAIVGSGKSIDDR